jgi:hypothetical protein
MLNLYTRSDRLFEKSILSSLYLPSQLFRVFLIEKSIIAGFFTQIIISN